MSMQDSYQSPFLPPPPVRCCFGGAVHLFLNRFTIDHNFIGPKIYTNKQQKLLQHGIVALDLTRAAILRGLVVRLDVDHLVRRSRCSLGALHAWQSLRYPLEERLDVVSQLRARLDEHQVVLLGLILALLRRHLALAQVRLVAHQDDDDIVAAFRPDVVDPLSCVLEAFGICCKGKDINCQPSHSRNTNKPYNTGGKPYSIRHKPPRQH